MPVSNITTLNSSELDKKHQLEQSIIEGIEAGKRGFQQAAQALLRIDELGLWRDEAVSFDAYREKFKAVLEDLNITDRHLNRLIAAEKCVQMLRPIGLNISQYKESHIRPLTQLKEPKQIQQAYKRSLEIAESEGCDLKAEHVQQAVEEIKPPKVRLPKPPRIPIGTTVQILPHYGDEEFHGAEGVITQHPNHDRCVVRFDDQTSKLIPDNFLVRVEEIRDFSLVSQENKEVARSLGLKTGLQAIPDAKEPDQEKWQQETEIAIAAFLRMLPKLSYSQKGLIYEQLLKSGFMPGKVAA
ncbi:MAG: hypothetical protein RMY28_009325 [Nostoc sp. ChiSLP01]|nr:hypothetical protein [Nostoc sp. CmiSLP01]MDZ8285244.1 hypothetical protein [Nostoc sp. ChiSLP01]